MRHLNLILGDQLSFSNPALDGFDPARDVIVMIEAASEGMTVWSHKARIALFLSAMRHFALEIGARGWPFIYLKLDDALPSDFATRLAAVLDTHQPQAVRVAEPGEWRMQTLLETTCAQQNVPLLLIDDSHFLCGRAEFAAWAKGKKELRMGFFYRQMRKKHRVLIAAGQPEGDSWNVAAEKRSAYPHGGSGQIAPPARFAPDAITQEVLALVDNEFDGHPGSLADFGWPVTREQALTALQCCIDERLEKFDASRDAIWSDTPFGWHALLSTSLSLHLLNPREVIAAAAQAYRQGRVPLASAEGFIRQLLGWREFIRGAYWLDMPSLKTANHYGHQRALPRWYWTGETDMACLRAAIGQTLQYGYVHQIQRLMLTGNFALLAEISPQQVADWTLAVSVVDAVESAALPKTAGIAAGRYAGKPYLASGADIKRQSNYCRGCRYDPAQRIGPDACPLTTLYWHFLDQHEATLAQNPRTALMAKNISRLSAEERGCIQSEAARVLTGIDTL